MLPSIQDRRCRMTRSGRRFMTILAAPRRAAQRQPNPRKITPSSDGLPSAEPCPPSQPRPGPPAASPRSAPAGPLRTRCAHPHDQPGHRMRRVEYSIRAPRCCGPLHCRALRGLRSEYDNTASAQRSVPIRARAEPRNGPVQNSPPGPDQPSRSPRKAPIRPAPENAVMKSLPRPAQNFVHVPFSAAAHRDRSRLRVNRYRPSDQC